MSNISFKLRLLNGLFKLTNEKQSTLPLFHGNDVSEFIEADTLKKSLNEKTIKVGRATDYSMNEKGINEFIKMLVTDKKINSSGVGIMKDGVLIANYYNAPYQERYRHVSYSMCKSVVAMAIGLLVDRGLLDIEEKLSDIFPEHSGIFMKKSMKNVTIKNLLTMTTGVKFDEVSSFFHSDWKKSFMGSDTLFEPGEDFLYNSMNSYMLAAVVKEKTGKQLIDYLQANLFDELGIHDITWDKCPYGTEKGGWGMKLSLIDMLKLGQLYLDNGAVYRNGIKKQLISEKWIADSISCQSFPKKKSIIRGYGYQIWLLRDGAYLFNGVFGQNVYINPERKIVIAISASGYELFPDGRLVELIMDFVARDENFHKKSLHFYEKGLRFEVTGPRTFLYNISRRFPLAAYIRKKKNRYAFEYIRQCFGEYDDIEYCFDEYATGILPIFSQVIYSNYLLGISSIKLSLKKGEFWINITDSGVCYRLKVGFDDEKPYEYQLIEIGGKTMPIAVGCAILKDEEENINLLLKIVYLEEISNKYLRLCFTGDGLKLLAQESPNMIEFSDKLFKDDKMQKTRMLKKMHNKDYIKYKLQKIFTANVKGRKSV